MRRSRTNVQKNAAHARETTAARRIIFAPESSYGSALSVLALGNC